MYQNRSTTKNPTPEEIIELDFRPKIDENAETELFIGATIGEQNDGVIYSDQTGNFPVQSYHSKRLMMVIYEYSRGCRALSSIFKSYGKSKKVSLFSTPTLDTQTVPIAAEIF